MKKPLKMTLWIVAIVIVLLIAAPIILANAINPNQFKPQIEKIVYEKTGRILKIPGNLSWHFFPSLGIKTGVVSLNNPKGFTAAPFLTLRSANISVAVLPLLSHRLDVKQLTLNGLQLHLIQKSELENNWTFGHVNQVEQSAATAVVQPAKGVHATASEQMAKIPASPHGKATQYDERITLIKPMQFRIHDVAIQGATIYFNNVQKQQTYALQNLNLEANHITSGRPFQLKSNFEVLGNQPPMHLAVSLIARMQINWQRQAYTFHQLNLQEHMTSGDAKTGVTTLDSQLTGKAKVNTRKGTLSLQTEWAVNHIAHVMMKLSVSHMLSETHYTGSITLQPFDLDHLMASLGKKTLSIPHPQALSPTSGDIQFTGSDHNIDFKSVHATMGNTILQGNLSVQNFKAPTLNTQLHINTLNIDNFANLKGASLPMQGLTLSVNLHANGISKAQFPGTLNGNIDAAVDHMTLKGIAIGAIFTKLEQALSQVGHGGNAWQILGQLQKILPTGNINPHNGQVTRLGHLTAVIPVQNGVATVQQMDVLGQDVVIKGTGVVNLNQKTIRLAFNAHSPRAKIQQNIPQIVIPFYVQGTFAEPQYGVRWHSVQSQIANFLGQSLLKQGLQKLIGSHQQQPSGNDQQNRPNSPNQPLQQRIGDAIKGILGH